MVAVNLANSACSAGSMAAISTWRRLRSAGARPSRWQLGILHQMPSRVVARKQGHIDIERHGRHDLDVGAHGDRRVTRLGTVQTVATVTLDSERWLHETKAASDLARALVWSKQHPASDLRNDALLVTAAIRPPMKCLTYAADMYNFLYTTGL